MMEMELTLTPMATEMKFLLQRMPATVDITPSLINDWIFESEVSAAPYMFHADFAGMGANNISHIPNSHLTDDEKRLDRELNRIPCSPK